MRDRILYSDNGTLVDITDLLYNYHSGSYSFNYIAGEDYIYIGTPLPFNHRYFDLSSVNALASEVEIEYWADNQWKSVVDKIDETSLSGASFGQSGFIEWTPDREYNWKREHTNDNGANIINELSSVTIYDLYWSRISFSSDLTGLTALSFVGQKFCDDNDIGAEYPELVRSNVLNAYKSGKTDWEEQIILASQLMVKDMISKKIIITKDQILDRFRLRDACVSKTAAIIFKAFGDDYTDQRIEAERDYQSRVKADIFNIDTNRNARLDVAEQGLRQGSLIR